MDFVIPLNMEKYDIKKLVDKVCSQSCSYDMERLAQKELDRVYMGNVDNLSPKEWDNYCQCVYDIHGYVHGRKIRNFIPEFKPLVDKLKNQ